MVAPSLIPKKPGARVKTNRRDAVSLTKLLRAGELTAVWEPDERHEAMRDLSRARQATKKDLQSKRQQISSLMLWQGRIYPDSVVRKKPPVAVAAIAPRARGFRLGDQSRGHGTSKGITQPGAVDRSSRDALDRAHSPSVATTNKRDSRTHQSCRGEDGTTAGELPTESMWPIIDRRPTQDRDSPRRKNGNPVANPRIRACSPTSSGPVLSSSRSTA